jgi:hypothetical protein
MASFVLLSEEARALVRPLATYRQLATAEVDDKKALAQKVAFFLVFIGAFVSLTASGRVVAMHVAGTMLFWCFAPLVQMAVVSVVLRLFAPKAPRARSLWLYFAGHGPWMFLLLALAAVCLFAPNVYDVMMWLVSTLVLPLALIVTIVWSIVLTVAFFRAGVGMSRARAAGATVTYYLLYIAAIASWYFATNQIQPQLFGVPA